MAGAAVMATGIVSVGCHLVGAEVLSRVLLGVAAVGWVVLVGVFLGHFFGEREQWWAESRTAASLTGVAGTAVVGTRSVLLGWTEVGWALLGVAAVSWVGLLPQVVRRLGRRVPGSAYLTCVATQSLGVLGATLAAATGVTWPLPVAVVLLVVGFGLYVLVLLHFDFHQLKEGAGDHWVACGALAISALAAGKLTAASGAPLKWAKPLRPWLLAVTLVLLLAALAWYAVIAVAELRWPRPGYDPRRWATVFPLGMTAVAALTAAGEVGPATSGWLEPLGRVLLWVAVAVWALVAAGLARRLAGGALSRTP
ncbi:tellurite resistance/C4-dicarboxylate transporter family protein [Streptomyces sp. A10(2020)]|uniref:tellurite resistance/C4-dicarboxylate transporter family protein n=1 Tax=Streptomyces sp. A10(2020) TaxID=2782013 RepID=UPI001F5C4221|nr:tellurite resistance/C4-dicarboxylate transporter family protein [Streptomyces sp. A10(2020)]UNR59062.1 tellurite resistance/C4-dicarboxylate transporter family protein [Streptomyces sp. A10(2020)]